MHHPGRKATPAQIVAKAQSTNCKSIAYTYTEPTIFFEYAYDVALLAHQAGLANVFVTNGYMSMDMLSVFEKTLDGANVDLKSFRNDTYRRYVGAKLQPVLDSLIRMKELGIWVEVTTLVIPEINDDPAELREIAAFIAQELGTETPWHISRFFPTYKLTDHSPTPSQRLQQAREIGLEEGLHYVYVGNLRQGIGEDTQCPNCKTALIRRYGYLILANRMRGDRCPECGAVIAGVELGGLNQ
jgi:pyruvate formate lyase activating enzyme